MQSLLKQFKQLVFKANRLRPTPKRITVCSCNLHATTQFGRNTGVKTALAAGLFASLALFSAYSLAAAPVLATKPLSASNETVKPNIMFVLDTSFSMALDSANDALNGFGQCKMGTNSSGYFINTITRGPTLEKPNNPNTVLTITTKINPPSIYKGFSVNFVVPGNPEFSGKYVAKRGYINRCSRSDLPITVTVGLPYCAGYSLGTPYTDPPIPACTCDLPAPANTPNTTNGVKLTSPGSTNPNVCFWYDPLDQLNEPMICTPEYIIELDVAAGVGTPTTGSFSAEQLLEAQIGNSSEYNYCMQEPPRMAAKVEPLFYDPSVEYVPPPSPKKVGLGKLSPDNRLPSMTRSYTSDWSKVSPYGSMLLANGEPERWQDTAKFAPFDSPNTLREGWVETVYCDTMNTPAGFISDRLWHESSHCKRNTPDNTSSLSNTSPRYPYPYPGQTDGGTSSSSKTNFYEINIAHQNGVPKRSTDNPVADLFAFAKYYRYAKPYYYTIQPIEYCDSPALSTCKLSSTLATTPDAAYSIPAYVRYCKTSVQATDTSTSPPAEQCQGLYKGDTAVDYRFARYGLFTRVDVVETKNSYAKSAGRTDCTGTTCTYDQEMTNMANWYAYYRTRLQLMTTTAARTFETLGDNTRVGLITVEGYTTPGNYLPIKDFTNTNKEQWLNTLYSRTASGGTSLRDVLSKVGQIYAGKKPITGFNANADDPVQFSCQQNFALLTTDGYWNGAEGKQIDGTTAIGDMDGDGTPRPMYQGNVASGTLADVAKYYYDTDLRNATLNNCTPNGSSANVCSDDVPVHGIEDVSVKQHMTTYTLGLGVSGNLLYTTNYKTSTTGDYASLKDPLGTVKWPVPATDDGYSPLTASERATVDDLWHAAVNGHGTYFSAKSPGELIASLSGTIRELGDGKGRGTGSTTELSNLKPVAGDNYAYSARYFTGTWSGNLFKRTIDGEGNLSAKALNCVEDDTSVSCVRDSGTGLGAKVQGTADTRKIYANVSGTLTSFKYSELTGDQKAYFQQDQFNGTTVGQKLSQWDALTSNQKGMTGKEKLVDYLRGQTAYDDRATNDNDNRIFRERSTVLGDVIDSDPVFVGKPQYDYLDAGYLGSSGYVVTAASNTSKTVYIGANDGMLHAFNADTLEERWAYVPTMVMPNMWKLADRNYSSMHTNFVNGKMTVADIKTTNGWKTILVSGLGQGGRGFFALDITDPTSPKMLWEKSVSDDNNIGYSYGKPVITKKPDGTWVVLITSGYNNTSPGDGKGHLYVLDASTGAMSDIATDGSGLAQISGYASSPNINNAAQYVYGGDLQGKVWRFDIKANTAFKLTTLVSVNGDAQPITVAPTLGTINNQRILFIGTGKYLEVDDADPTYYKTQSIYAIKDDNVSATITGLRGQMVQQTLTTVGSNRTASNNLVDWASKLGWYVDLGTGERQNIKAYLISGVLIAPTNIPPVGSCSVGSGWINVFNYKTGGAVDPSVSNIASTFSSKMLAGLYFTSSDASPNTVHVKVDTVDGSNENKVCIGTGCDGAVKLIGEAAFAGGRATWRELIPAE